MSGTNQYLAFGTAGGANVLLPAAYAALAARSSGFANGIADPAQANTAWRQSSVAAAAVAQFICDYALVNASDDGSVSNFENGLVLGLNALVASVLAAGTIIREAKVAASIVAGVVNFDFSLGNTFVVLMNANITGITFSNFPPSGKVQSIAVIWVADGTAHGVTGLAAAIIKWLGASGAGSAPTFTFTTGYENLTTFIARDGVTTRVVGTFDGTAAA